ncbi:sulfite exporter TauE/SafE family protein [Shimia sp. W99]|uniref:Probable membrane transporter protein n=1 Tax=Shimia aestuarii TaxID=254406 RepID=A0A1I4N921_9RHOB|nr:sulfite exporter TauE/SafE family protein [Shimia aestuarii]SFM11989.1 hypothetical protein SAMN04488042_10453 [Shimia aestuarii]
MPDALWQVLDLPGVYWAILAAFVAGIVRGFSGFGTALIYLPVAAQVMPPIWAVITLTVMDVFGPLPAARGAWRACHRRDLGRLLLATMVAVPFGVLVLRVTDPAIYRYAISLIALAMLGLLISGFRYRGTVSPRGVYGIGGGAGFLGGVAGLPGPVVILFYMASPHGPAVIRANTLLYLWGFDVLLLATLGLQGVLEVGAIWLGIVLIPPSIAGIALGTAIFNPERERLYRRVAYLVIAVSAISGLPFWTS